MRPYVIELIIGIGLILLYARYVPMEVQHFIGMCATVWIWSGITSAFRRSFTKKKVIRKKK